MATEKSEARPTTLESDPYATATTTARCLDCGRSSCDGNAPDSAKRDQAVCLALARVRRLARFDDSAGAAGFLASVRVRADDTVRDTRDRPTKVIQSMRTIALLREWRRIRMSDAHPAKVLGESAGRKCAFDYIPLRLVDRIRAADAVAAELAESMDQDFREQDVDIDRLVGDHCPRCGREKTGGEGSREYWCDACVAAARAEVER
jgi:hypothetical protein